MKEIKVIVDKNGEITVDTSGFTGDECLKETENLKKLLGKVVKTKEKPEIFLANTKKLRVKRNGI